MKLCVTLDSNFGDSRDSSDSVGCLAEVVALVGLLDVLDDERAFNDLDVAVVGCVEVLVVVGRGPHLRVKHCCKNIE